MFLWLCTHRETDRASDSEGVTQTERERHAGARARAHTHTHTHTHLPDELVRKVFIAQIFSAHADLSIYRSPPVDDRVTDTSHVSGDVSDDSDADASDDQVLQEASPASGVFACSNASPYRVF